MTVPYDKRVEFWGYLTKEKYPRPAGVTAKRLAQMADTVLENDYIWEDVIVRHGAGDYTPQEFYASGTPNAEHSRSNFWAMVREQIMLRDAKPL